LNLDEATRK